MVAAPQAPNRASPQHCVYDIPFRGFMHTPSTNERLTAFFHEVGQLQKLPRSGYAFLGSGCESVAEHSFRTAIIGCALARIRGADAGKTALLCLFHDLAETRTGDQNAVNRHYVQTDERKAVCDALKGTGLEAFILPLWEEQEARQSTEAMLARDADQLDLLLSLKKELDLGNPQAALWMERVQSRLLTDLAREVAQSIASQHFSAWWQHV